jgi:hypothetical protein
MLSHEAPGGGTGARQRCLSGERPADCWEGVGGGAPEVREALNQAKVRPCRRRNRTQEGAGSSPASSMKPPQVRGFHFVARRADRLTFLQALMGRPAHIVPSRGARGAVRSASLKMGATGPGCIRRSPSTSSPVLQGMASEWSPLTDSNRRPSPYHALRSATGRSPRQRFAGFEPFLMPPFATSCHWLRPLCSISAPSCGTGMRPKETSASCLRCSPHPSMIDSH